MTVPIISKLLKSTDQQITAKGILLHSSPVESPPWSLPAFTFAQQAGRNTLGGIPGGVLHLKAGGDTSLSLFWELRLTAVVTATRCKMNKRPFIVN
jgi:hypothetical protein